jgi:integrase/recombinase XerD
MPQPSVHRAGLLAWLEQCSLPVPAGTGPAPTCRRDHALLLLAVQTGLRVSELTSLRIRNLALGNGAHMRCTGKGRKDRATPLTRQTAAVLRVYLAERHGEPEAPLFPGPAGSPLSTDAVRRLVERHAADSARHCPSLGAKHVSPNVLRHTRARFECGIDLVIIPAIA